MQQLQRDAFLSQLVVHPVPVWHGTGRAARNRRRFGEKQSIEIGLVEVVGKRPLQTGCFGPAEVVGYSAAGDAHAPSNLTVAQRGRAKKARGDRYAPPGGLVELDAQGRGVRAAYAG